MVISFTYMHYQTCLLYHKAVPGDHVCAEFPEYESCQRLSGSYPGYAAYHRKSYNLLGDGQLSLDFGDF